MDIIETGGTTVQQAALQGTAEAGGAPVEDVAISARGAPESGVTSAVARADAEARAAAKKKAARKTGDKVRAQLRDRPLSKPGERLSFEGRKPASDRLKDVAARPGREALLAAKSQSRKDGADNSGIQAANLAVDGAERTGSAASAAARKQAQKKAVKRGYAKAMRVGKAPNAGSTAATVKRATAKAKEASKDAAALVRRHWKGIGIAFGIVWLVALAFAGLSSCGASLQSGLQSIIATSYTSEDPDIEGTDAEYAALEAGLRSRVDRTETDYPGYDEYRYGLAEAGHDPFELASYLTTRYQAYTPATARTELQRLFNQQYSLTLTPVTETRYRTEGRTGYRTEERTGYRDEQRTGYREEERTGYRFERDPETGRYVRVPYTYTVEVEYTYTVSVPYTYTVQVPYTYTVQVPYSYHILNVKLVNRSLGAVAVASLNPEQKEMYAVYQETRGNKPYLFAGNPYVSRGEYTDYDIPPEALTDATFAAMMREAEKYLGWPYVWGGASPSTSFDCSGYVSWVVNHSGWDMGRLGAQGLMDRCSVIAPPAARPGDLIFFQGTYDTAGASHVGIYVGGGMMIHAGNPISYASVETGYWQGHFLAIGRLP
jgi:cell wall-associated NlpC family hydrolase